MAKNRTVPASWILAGGLLVGLAGDALLRVGGPPAINLTLWAVLVAGVSVWLYARSGRRLSREALVWLLVAIAFAGALAWRDSEPLKLLALAASAAAFALPAYRAGAAWLRQSGLPGYCGALVTAALRAAVGGFLVLRQVDWNSLRGEPENAWRWRRAAAVGRGVLIAIPLLLVFGGLLTAADQVFASLVTDSLRLDFGRVASHVVLTGIFGWIAIGYAHGLMTGTSLHVAEEFAPKRPSLGIAEIGVPLGLLALLFLVFVVVQFRYLFGGADLVAVTPGLSFAEYARRGFFELLFTAALLLPLLLAADWLLARGEKRDERVFRLLAGAHVILILLMMASALERLRLYLEAYGLTVPRFYAAALMGWLVLVFLWFAGTVLRGRQGFAFGVLVSAYLWLAALQIANPERVVARTSLTRAEAGRAFDVLYFASLSADAVPVVVGSFEALPADARCVVAHRLLGRWGPEQPLDWRQWSLSTARARAEVAEAAPQLRTALGPGARCQTVVSARA